jgi:hypothetical protein
MTMATVASSASRLVLAAALLCSAWPGGIALAQKEAIDAPAAPVRVAQDRQRPGGSGPRDDSSPPIDNPGAVAPPQFGLPREFIPVPDRWRLIEAIGVKENYFDPYNQNTLKADRPIFGNDWFINLSLVSDTVVEPSAFPKPVGGGQATNRPNTLDIFGRPDQFLFNQQVIGTISLIKGDTAYKPPDIELRLTPVFNYNKVEVEEVRLLRIDPNQGTSRTDHIFALQEGFLDYHIRNVSDRFDFDSLRVGIQPFSSDFRGFLFQDIQLGARLFGNRDNNKIQYNLAYFRRLEKDTNSGLNDITLPVRDDTVAIANLYWQDLLVLGFVPQVTFLYNRNREGSEPLFFDNNGFLARPASFGNERGHDYDAYYLGFNGDGHFGRFNLTGSFYYAFGKDFMNQFTGQRADISAFFIAAEPSIDFSWIRLRGSFVYSSGDKDPFDNKQEGFDAIFENPQIAGADTSFWIRQQIPLIGGGGVSLKGRNSVIPALRTSKELGQSNFVNPGILLVGGGGDFDILPELRATFNANYLRFADTKVLEVARNQGNIREDIGYDISLALTYRPLFIQNVVFRLSGALLFAGDGFRDLFADRDQDVYYSVLANLILTY